MTEQKGLILINTGTGKGKTTAALGTAIRAWGNGQKVLILQFIKGAWKYGELKAIEALEACNGNIEIRPMGDGFVFHNRKEDEAAYQNKKELAARAWETVVDEVMSDRWDLVVLDEVNYALKYELIELNEVLAILDNKDADLHLVLTGRDVKDEIMARADMVTEMKEIKHHYKNGIKAQRGIEF